MHFKSTSLLLDWPTTTWAFHVQGSLLRTHYCVILVQLIFAMQSNFSEWNSVVKGLTNVLIRKFYECDWKLPRNFYSLPPPLTTTWALLWNCLVFRTQTTGIFFISLWKHYEYMGYMLWVPPVQIFLTSSSIRYFHFFLLNDWWSWTTNLYDVMQTWNALGFVQPWWGQNKELKLDIGGNYVELAIPTYANLMIQW